MQSIIINAGIGSIDPVRVRHYCINVALPVHNWLSQARVVITLIHGFIPRANRQEQLIPFYELAEAFGFSFRDSMPGDSIAA